MNTTQRLTPTRPEDRKEYLAVHKWVRKNKGVAYYCENDAAHTSKRYDWANISGEYQWRLSDYKSLCRRCHDKSDGRTKRLAVLNKGNTYRARPIIMIFPRGHWIKFESCKLAAKQLGVLQSSINNCLAGRSKTCAGYKWRYSN